MDEQERWYLETLPLAGAVVADVGANVGRLSQFFWEQVGPSGRVVSIEPQPDNLRALDRRVREAAADNWRIEACAVSASEGALLMRAFDVDYGKNSVVAAEPVDAVYQVESRRLQDLVPDATVVKLDIEGHEYQVMPSAVPALERARAWALELHMVEGHPLEEALQLFVDHGFSLHAAGKKRDDPTGAWLGVPIAPTLSWAQIPGTPTVVDGLPDVFKMLHVIALRR
jgi:FkbM family methyltransferase